MNTIYKDPYVNYNGNKIEILGEYIEDIEVNGINKRVKLLVTNNNNSLLFDRNFNFELVQVNSTDSNQTSILTEEIRNKYNEVFSSRLGAYKFSKISLSMDINGKPIFSVLFIKHGNIK